jgi:hypothetical protein
MIFFKYVTLFYLEMVVCRVYICVLITDLTKLIQQHENFIIMKVLVACEESQTVCKAFRSKGHEAYSCDLLPCSGGHPEWHFQQDIFEVIDMGWDLMIAHPPCTHLAVSGAKHFEKKKADGRQQQGIDFFMAFTKTNIPKVCIENPMGIMSTIYRKPDQIIHPYYFGDEAQKTTCLWLKGLKPLYHLKQPDLFSDAVTHVGKGDFYEFTSKSGVKKRQPMWFAKAFLNKDNSNRAHERSFRFAGVAKAMAEQWGDLFFDPYNK